MLLTVRSFLRIIPARAGFTRRPRGSRPRPRDHPRSRGVYHATGSRVEGLDGSSPLARGLLHRQPPLQHRQGIIPARAGFTRPPRPPVRARKDHPRSRGVYGRMTTRQAEKAGSSPLARGLRRLGIGLSARLLDHPRSRGVYGQGRRSLGLKPGSSPLARGLRGRLEQDRRPGRIIPARAGFTRSRTR